MLDNSFGLYPYVTASNVIEGGVNIGSGVPSKKLMKFGELSKPILQELVAAHYQRNYLKRSLKIFENEDMNMGRRRSAAPGWLVRFTGRQVCMSFIFD